MVQVRMPVLFPVQVTPKAFPSGQPSYIREKDFPTDELKIRLSPVSLNCLVKKACSSGIPSEVSTVKDQPPSFSATFVVRIFASGGSFISSGDLNGGILCIGVTTGFGVGEDVLIGEVELGTVGATTDCCGGVLFSADAFSQSIPVNPSISIAIVRTKAGRTGSAS